MSINHVTVSGNLTRDPEVRTTASGKPVMSFGIAVNDRRRNGDIELTDEQESEIELEVAMHPFILYRKED